MKLNYQSFLIIVALTALVIGFAIRIKIYTQYTPLGVTDLSVIKQLWDGEYYLRENQFGLATIIAVISKITHYDFANSAALLSLISSIACMLIIPSLLYLITKSIQIACLSIIVYALSSEFIFVTLQAQSESPFLLFTLVSYFLLIYFLKFHESSKKNKLCIYLLLVFSLAFAISIKPNSLFHVTIYIIIYLIFYSKHLRLNQLLPILLIVPFSLIIFFSAKHIFLKTRPQVEKIAHTTDYTKFVLIENILVEPFSWDNDSESIINRLKSMKSLKVLESNDSEFDPDFIDTSLPLHTIIWDNKIKYFSNVFWGIIQTAKAILFSSKLNYSGILFSLIGLIVIIFSTNSPNLRCFILSWLFVYLFVVPFFIVHGRSIWPVGFIVTLGSIFSLNYIICFLDNYIKKCLRIKSFILFALICFMSIDSLNAYHNAWYLGTDRKQLISKVIDDRSINLTPTIMTYDQGITTFGRKKRFLQLPFEVNVNTMYGYILEKKPHFIFLSNDLINTWHNPHDTTIKAINLLNIDNEKVYDLVFEDSRCSLWQLQKSFKN